MATQPSKSDYGVPKVQEQKVKVPAKQGGNTDIKMKNPAPKGPASNPASDKNFQQSFSAEKDLKALIAAASVRANKGRLAAALALQMKQSGGPVGEKKGANNAGVRTKTPNKFDNVSGAQKANSGTKMDGQKGRW